LTFLNGIKDETPGDFQNGPKSFTNMDRGTELDGKTQRRWERETSTELKNAKIQTGLKQCE